MAYVIAMNCRLCGVCATQCPVGAIYEDATQFTIDTEKCVECGICETQCPVHAISLE